MKSVGLINTGSICYLNSLLQSLACCPIAVHAILTASPTRQPEAQIAQILKSFLHGNANASSQLHAAINAVSRHKFRGQESSSEFLIVLLEHFPALARVFAMEQADFAFCPSCGHRSEVNKKEEFTRVLYVPITNIQTITSDIITPHPCPSCATQMKHKSLITRFPRILLLQLNVYDHKQPFGLKTKYTFTFPDNDPDKNYDCKALICHSGSINGGHYVAIGERGQKTYLFNDTSITAHPLTIGQNTYLAFFELCRG